MMNKRREILTIYMIIIMLINIVFITSIYGLNTREMTIKSMN
jgi:Mg2+ and Co2+ transporter CorA